MSDDIKRMAHSLLAKQQNASAHAQPAQGSPELHVHKRPSLPKHVLQHAHEYVTKIMRAKGMSV